jgi:hypothetical protein
MTIEDPSEHIIQARLLKILVWAARPEIKIVSVPNAGKRSFIAAAKLKAEGMTAGIPDLMVLFPIDQGAIAWLEMKTRSGSLSTVQLGFKAWCERSGHRWAMARSVDEALDVLRGWNALKPGVII